MPPDKDDLPADNDLPAQICIFNARPMFCNAVQLDLHIISTGTGQDSSAGKADGSSSIEHFDGRLRSVCQLGPDLLHVCRGRGAQSMAWQSHKRKYRCFHQARFWYCDDLVCSRVDCSMLRPEKRYLTYDLTSVMPYKTLLLRLPCKRGPHPCDSTGPPSTRSASASQR